jgi:transcriptional regulator with XRE-family HTH domain
VAACLAEAHARGISQSAIAARAGCSQMAVSAYGRGLRLPTPARLRRLTRALSDFGIACEDLALLGRAELRWERITAIDLVPYEGYAYDLQVAEEHLSGRLPHNFAADGLLTSNSMTTVHARSAHDALGRLMVAALQEPGGAAVGRDVLREIIAGNIDLVVYLEKRQGRRLVTEVLEVDPSTEGGVFHTRPLWELEGDELKRTTLRPALLDRIARAGIPVPFEVAA